MPTSTLLRPFWLAPRAAAAALASPPLTTRPHRRRRRHHFPVRFPVLQPRHLRLLHRRVQVLQGLQQRQLPQPEHACDVSSSFSSSSRVIVLSRGTYLPVNGGKGLFLCNGTNRSNN